MFKKLLTIPKFQTRNLSALYVSADKASETYSVLTPHIDFETQLQNRSKIIQNLEKRNHRINLEDVICTWIFYKKILTQRNELERTKTKIATQIKQLDSKKDLDEVNKLINHGRLIKNDLKALRASFNSVEENAMLKVLSLPNALHERASIESQLIYSQQKDSRKQTDHHLEIGTKLNLIDFRGNHLYYLKNDATLFELASCNTILSKLLQKGFINFSNSDFARSVVVEGCALNNNEVFTIADPDAVDKVNNLHLVGGASLPSFMAYFTKHTVHASQLPLKLVTVGRKYVPTDQVVSLQPSSNDSLLNVHQSTCVEFFVATKDDHDSQNVELDNVIADILELYKTLNYDFGLTYVPAKSLHDYESLRVSIRMFSNFLKDYVEVGHVSVLDSYVSKRLLFNYGTGFDMSFPKVLCGTIFNVSKVLACLLESDPRNLLNDELKTYFC